MKAYDSVEDYFADASDAHRAELQRLRALVKRTVPEAVEQISYGMPAFKYKNKPLFYYGAFKNHISVFPTPGPIVDLGDQIDQYKTGKGTLSYSVDKPMPDSIIFALLDARKAHIDA